MNKKYEDLVPFVEKYKEELAAVDVRRKLWNKKIKPLIKKSSKDFIKAFKLTCFVAEETSLTNQEAIYLSFEDKDTGIVQKSTKQQFVQSGGGLVYYQIANGKISAEKVLPYIEHIKGEKGEKKALETVKPENIDEELILSHIQKFFKETLEWECFLRQTIGFNH